MRIVKLLLAVAALLLATTAHAHAGPIAGAIAFVAGILKAGGIAALLIKAAFSIALNVGLSLLQRAMQKKPREPGFAGELQAGEETPRSFMMGWSRTAGTLVYADTWGQDGKTPNAFLVMVIALADVPMGAMLSRIWIDGEEKTIQWGAGTGPGGDPIRDYGETDLAWIKYHDGTQTEADAFLLSTFGGLADRPWKADMIGRGVPYAILTFRFKRAVFQGPPRVIFEVEGMRLYDPRKDTTAGGSGAHRWTDPATWEPSNNPIVQVYNIARGIHHDGEWLYGGQDWPAFRLPAASWIAAMNACDATVEIDGGEDTEPQYRAGVEVAVDMEPLDVIDELLKAAHARLVDVGGIYKIVVGTPGAAVYAFTDDDIVVTEGQSFDPFPGLDQTHNAITASYPEPAEAWEAKDAPPRYDAAYEAEDDGRRLVAAVRFPAVPYGRQVQRLMLAMLRAERRFRRHVITLPPDAWLLEPGDVVSWTSARNGYAAKKFMVMAIDGPPSFNQSVSLLEVDPSDYDWSTDDELPITIGPLGPRRPAPQALAGWQVDRATLTDDAGRARPSIQVSFDGDLDDVRAVRVQVRLASSQAVVYDGELPYGAPDEATKTVVLNGVFLPDTAYQVRGILLPFSGRDAAWSAWLAVTTDDARIAIDDLRDDIRDDLLELEGWIDDGLEQKVLDNTADILKNAEDLAQEITDRIADVADEAAARADAVAEERDARLVDSERYAGSIRDMVETIRAVAFTGVHQSHLDYVDRKRLKTELTSRVDNAAAAFLQVIEAGTGPTSALVASITSLDARVDTEVAGLNAAIQAVESAYADADSAEASAREALAAQLRGSYEGSDLGQVTEGLIYSERTARVAQDAALATSISLLSAGVGTLFDWITFWFFDTDGDAEGWTGNGAPSVAGGTIRPANHASDPYLVSPSGLGITANQYNQVKVFVTKVGAPAWEGYLWWKAEGDSTWDAARRVQLAEPSYDTNGKAVVTFDPEWSGTIDQIRLDLSSAADDTDHFVADWVSIGRPSPGASYAQIVAEAEARATADLAEAAAREALSSTLTGTDDPTGLGLGDLSQGLIYQEREARSTEDAALASEITGVSARLDDAENDLSGLSQVQQTLDTRVTVNEGDIAVNAAAILDLEAGLEGKADVGVTDALEALIEDLGGAGLTALGRAIRAIRTELDDLALTQSQLGIFGLADKQRLAGTIADVSQTLTSRIDASDEEIVLLGEVIDAIELTLGDVARVGALDALTARVTANEDEIVALASAVTAIEASIDDIESDLATKASADALSALDVRVTASEGEIAALSTALTALEAEVEDKADASALQALTTRVTVAEGDIAAISSAITNLQAEVDGVTAGGRFRIQTYASPGEAWARIGLEASADDGQTFASAAMFMDARTSAGPGEPLSRVIFRADRFAVTDGSAENYPFVFQGGVAYLENVNIENAEIGNLQVGTSNIEPGAVSEVNVVSPNDVQLQHNIFVQVASVVHEGLVGAKRWISFNCDITAYSQRDVDLGGQPDSSVSFSIEIRRGATVIAAVAGDAHFFYRREGRLIIGNADKGVLKAMVDTGGGATETYSVHVRQDNQNVPTPTATNINFSVIELKR